MSKSSKTIRKPSSNKEGTSAMELLPLNEGKEIGRFDESINFD
jgi:transposase